MEGYLNTIGLHSSRRAIRRQKQNLPCLGTLSERDPHAGACTAFCINNVAKHSFTERFNRIHKNVTLAVTKSLQGLKGRFD